MRRHLAFTLVEVTISMLLFGLVMGSVLQCLAAVRSFSGSETASGDLNIEGQRVLASMVGDVSNAAWLIDPNFTTQLPTPFIFQPALDRSCRYYPFVLVQASTGVATGTSLSAWTRSAAYIPNLAASSYATLLPAEHKLQSQELVFTKVQRSAPSISPLLTTDHVNFNTDWTGAKLPVGTPWPAGVLPMANFQTGIKVHSVVTVYDDGGGDVADTPLVFESYTGSPNLTGNPGLVPIGVTRNNPDGLREYAYIVIPDAATGKNMLVRCWRNGSGVAPIYPPNLVSVNAGYDIISEYVDRIVIDTYRTLTTLDINQMRIRVYLSKDPPDVGSAAVITSTVECTCALRSTVDPSYSLNLGSWLGPAGTMHNFMNTETGVP
jgi:hypothetical protein